MFYRIISSIESVERRQHMTAQFHALGLEPQFFDAIMGKELSEEELQRWVAYPTMLTPGEIGCALSHLTIYEELLASDYEAVLIFEDDAIFTKDLTLSALQGFYNFVASTKEARVVTLHSTEIGYGQIASVDGVGIVETPRFMCTTGYMINRAAAEKILWAQRPLKFEIDQFRLYYFLGLTKLYAAQLNLITTNDELYPTMIGHTVRTNDEQRPVVRRSYFKSLLKQLSMTGWCTYIARRLRKHMARRLS